MKMEEKAATDEMTGLYNKNKLLATIEKRTYDYQQVAIVYWDINQMCIRDSIEPDILKEFYPASAPLCQDLPYHHRILLLLTIHSPPCNNFCFSIIPYRHFL